MECSSPNFVKFCLQAVTRVSLETSNMMNANFLDAIVIFIHGMGMIPNLRVIVRICV